MGAKTELLSREPLAMFATVSVAELGGEGHIADATLGLCFRAWLKMTTGGESGVNLMTPAALGFASAAAFGHLICCCLRWCRPDW